MARNPRPRWKIGNIFLLLLIIGGIAYWLNKDLVNQQLVESGIIQDPSTKPAPIEQESNEQARRSDIINNAKKEEKAAAEAAKNATGESDSGISEGDNNKGEVEKLREAEEKSKTVKAVVLSPLEDILILNEENLVSIRPLSNNSELSDLRIMSPTGSLEIKLEDEDEMTYIVRPTKRTSAEIWLTGKIDGKVDDLGTFKYQVRSKRELVSLFQKEGGDIPKTPVYIGTALKGEPLKAGMQQSFYAFASGVDAETLRLNITKGEASAKRSSDDPTTYELTVGNTTPEVSFELLSNQGGKQVVLAKKSFRVAGPNGALLPLNEASSGASPTKGENKVNANANTGKDAVTKSGSRPSCQGINSPMDNVLFAGVPNPVKFNYPEYRDKSFILQMSDKSLTTLKDEDEMVYVLTPKKEGEVQVKITSRVNTSRIDDLGTYTFTVLPTPLPTPFVEGQDAENIKVEDFKKAKGLSLKSNDAGMNIPFVLKRGYKLQRIPKNESEIVEDEITLGPEFSVKMKKLIDKAKPGDLYLFSGISCYLPSNKQERLSKLALTVVK